MLNKSKKDYAYTMLDINDCDIEMLKKGYHLIHIKNRSRWVTEEDIHRMARFVKHCAKRLQLDSKCILEGLRDFP